MREAGGCVLAQSQETAKFDEMPQRAIDTGIVDKALAPEEMIAVLRRNAERLAGTARGGAAAAGAAAKPEAGRRRT
ncbi:hypothetical protein BH23PSE1_BH23PSE1_16270 [soil metagenome]